MKLFISFFIGCCGAIKENACMLGTYFAIILVLFIALIVAAVVGYNMKFDGISEELAKTMDKYEPNDANSKTTKAWDKIQKDVSIFFNLSISMPVLKIVTSGFFNKPFQWFVGHYSTPRECH